MFSMNRRDIPPHLLKYFKPRKVYKPKDDLMIPHRVYDALMTDGWYGRSDIVWAKKAPMPESVQDRCTKAHEYVFLLAKSRDYFYDADAIREPHARQWDETNGRGIYAGKNNPNQKQNAMPVLPHPNGANRRSVWTLGPESYSGAHYAVMPTKLVEPCILAGTSAHGCCAACGAPWERVVEHITLREIGVMNDTASKRQGRREQGLESNRSGLSGSNNHSDMATSPITKTLGWAATCQCQADVVPCTVLDPFSGSGTVGFVAVKHNRHYIGIDLDERNISLAERRIQQAQPMLLAVP